LSLILWSVNRETFKLPKPAHLAKIGTSAGFASTQRSVRRKIAASKENLMQRRMSFWRGICVLTAVVVLAAIAPASAQTQGMERRNQRRDNRAAARAAKQECKAGDEKSRAECRQVKRGVKQAGRNNGVSNANAAPAPHPAE
jgi:anti-sigma-K factor RskA